MKKELVLVLAAVLLFSGCVGQANTVKTGDNVSVDYVGHTVDGKVFDTSIESVAKQNNLYSPERKYQPLKFTVGKGQMIKGFDEGVIGMKTGEKKTITVPPEKGYGKVDPKLVKTIPIIESIPATMTVPRTFEVPVDQFESTFGKNYSVGDSVNIPDTNINLTIKNIGTNISVSYDLPVGYKIVQKNAPWNETVISINNNNFTLKPDIQKNDVVRMQNVPWNSTVIAVNDTNITLKHNAIPDQDIPTLTGTINVHFNETSIIIDQNNKLAGKTLIFDVTLRSIG